MNKAMMKHVMIFQKVLPLFLMSLLMACGSGDESVTKPEVLQFGSSMEDMKEQMRPLCDSLVELSDEPIQLPTATQNQSQLDCYGFTYAGKKRKAELIFADDLLDMVWILTEADEEQKFIEGFKGQFGEPTHLKRDITFFLNNGAAVRNEPHEVLFISDRLKEPYGQWLESVD